MTESNTISFNRNTDEGPKEMLRLDKEGFHYNGEVIKDAGEAYKLFKQWLGFAHRTPTVTDLQEALADVGLIDRAALDDAEEYDGGATLAQVDEVHCKLFGGQE